MNLNFSCVVHFRFVHFHFGIIAEVSFSFVSSITTSNRRVEN